MRPREITTLMEIKDRMSRQRRQILISIGTAPIVGDHTIFRDGSRLSKGVTVLRRTTLR